MVHLFIFMTAIKHILKSTLGNFYDQPKQLTLVIIGLNNECEVDIGDVIVDIQVLV